MATTLQRFNGLYENILTNQAITESAAWRVLARNIVELPALLVRTIDGIL